MRMMPSLVVPAGPEPMKSAIVRIYAPGPTQNGAGRAVGVGFLVDDQFALTCAHVVYQALTLAEGDIPPEGAVIAVDLPLLADPESRKVLTASIEELIPRQPAGGGDVAVLRLREPVPGTWPVRLVPADGLWNHRAGAFGLPDGRPEGVWHTGLLKAAQASGWVQMNLDPASGGYAVSQGFSGGPVWDEELGGVAGMMVVAESGAPPVSYLIPAERLIAAWPRLRQLTLPPSPFRSLRPFEESDQAVFHGREDDSRRIAQAVARQDWTTLIGPSGSGKSSVARAGVVPLRRSAGELPVIIRPARGSSPLRALAAELVPLLEPGSSEMEELARADDLAGRLALNGLHDVVPVLLSRHQATGLLVVIDQFEELLDLDRQEISQLVTLLSGDRRPACVSVLATLRADFVEPVLNHELLGPVVSRTFEGLMPMNRAQLHRAITAPVDTVPGVSFEHGLAEQILEDAGTDIGALPLLGFTLDLLWGAQTQPQAGGQLTFQAYRALGGVSGALAAYAARAWVEVPEESRTAAQRLLPRLVRVPLGSEAPTRRVVPRSELGDDEWQVAQRLAAARLLVVSTRISPGPGEALRFDAESVELAHEVLILAWPELAQMVAADSAFLTWRETLRHDADRWEKGERSKELLPAKPVLDAADLWLPERERDLNGTERDFLRRGRAHHRSLRRRRAAAIVSACALVLAVISAGAVSLRLSDDNARAAARARANTLAAAAAGLQPTDPGLAGELAVAAYRSAPTQNAVNQLYATLGTPVDAPVGNTGDKILQIASQADGPLAAVINANGNLRVWNTASPAKPTLDAAIHAHASAVALAPRSRLMAAACPGPKRLCLWNLADPRKPAVISRLPLDFGAGARTGAAASSAAISPDGTVLAAALENGQTLLWSIAQPAQPRPLAHLANPARGAHDDLAAVAFAPRGHLLATTVQDGETGLWNLARPNAPVPVATIKTGYHSVAFNRDATLLAAAGDDKADIWRIRDPARPSALGLDPLYDESCDFSTAAFSPDGSRVAFGCSDGDDGKGGLYYYDVDPASLSDDLPQLTEVSTGFGIFSLAFTASGALLTGGGDRILRRWGWPVREAFGANPIDDNTWAESPDGTLLAASYGNSDTPPLAIWNMTAPGEPALDATIHLPAVLQQVGFLTRTTLLTVTHDGATRIWNLRDPRHPVQAADLGTADFVTAGAFIAGTGVSTNAAGTLAAVEENGNRLHLWRVNAAGRASSAGSIPVPDTSADPAGLMDNGTAVVVTSTAIDWWDTSDPDRPVRVSEARAKGTNKGTVSGKGDVFAGTTSEAATSGDVGLDVYAATHGRLRGSARLPGLVGSTIGISKNSRTLAVTGSSGNTISLWDISDIAHPRDLSAVTADGQVSALAFAPDGRLMADWTDSNVQVWDISNPEAPALKYAIPFSGDSSDASGTFTPYSDAITLFGTHGALNIDADPDELAARLCSYVGATITSAQWTRYAPGIPYQNPCRS